ncbi:hypothetical protein [Acinetobacter indicus]|uniref:hypothetical protein n=1 Tax=Acinetobacter indicus TaxID=756892 RepID=UPI0013157AB4|nr:hypothetical protein [Acinetobacter indicus]
MAALCLAVARRMGKNLRSATNECKNKGEFFHEVTLLVLKTRYCTDKAHLMPVFLAPGFFPELDLLLTK